ncbi:aminotransferase class I/II-fold pyridoxal phosphate-dependent enzyme [uncultured Sphingomonas sp.]|uniref:aminotransferase class I/II-fold pyridoxal phosphate-dependent enzyme n=1 Tax=uncultured Sphingomonas sp. TaxID=158754 RepID=UPI0035CB40F1
MTQTSLDAFRAHGGRIEAARAAFGPAEDGAAWIDLSTGIAPWSYPVAAGLGLDRLPEPDALAALEAAAADAFGVPGGRCVVAVPGSDMALRLLAVILPSRTPAVVRPGYAGHAAAWPAATPIADESLAEAAATHDPVVFASPANPDGRIADPAQVAAIAARSTVVADEAFADPAPGLASFDVGQASERLLVLRSFGKFYGLPGLRLGFVVCGPGVAARLRSLLGDWPVSGAAISIGCAAYRDAGWREAQAARIAAAGTRLDALLERTGLQVAGAASLFRLIACEDADALFRHLAARAILTRPFADRPGRLRLGLPADDAAFDRLAAALEEYPR